MTQDRDGLTIRGQFIRHTALVRLWVCGACGNRLKTIYQDGWLTVCAKDASHDSQQFMHRDAWLYVEAQRRQQAMAAEDVFAHLPPELQQAIRAA